MYYDKTKHSPVCSKRNESNEKKWLYCAIVLTQMLREKEYTWAARVEEESKNEPQCQRESTVLYLIIKRKF